MFKKLIAGALSASLLVSAIVSGNLNSLVTDRTQTFDKKQSFKTNGNSKKWTLLKGTALNFLFSNWVSECCGIECLLFICGSKFYR